MYATIIELCYHLTENYDLNTCNKYREQISAVKEQILFEKREIQDNYEAFLSSLEPNNSWEYFKSNKIERRAFFDNLKSGQLTLSVAEGLMKRAYSQAGKEYHRNEENFEVFQKFLKQFYPAIRLNEMLLEQVAHGNKNLQRIEDVRWNTIIDISIVFGALHMLKPEQEKILVTEEKAILHSICEYGNSSQAINLKTYLKKIKMNNVC